MHHSCLLVAMNVEDTTVGSGYHALTLFTVAAIVTLAHFALLCEVLGNYRDTKSSQVKRFGCKTKHSFTLLQLEEGRRQKAPNQQEEPKEEQPERALGPTPWHLLTRLKQSRPRTRETTHKRARTKKEAEESIFTDAQDQDLQKHEKIGKPTVPQQRNPPIVRWMKIQRKSIINLLRKNVQ